MAAPKDKLLQPSTSERNFPVVGVGGSEGELDAFKKLLKGIPANSGMAFVMVQHLNPIHESNLADILSRITKIPVMEITDEVKISPNNIYVMPSNKILTAVDGFLKLTPRATVTTNFVIDVFFTSLAVVWERMAVGVVLSGNGTDGTVGLKMIKDHGGITIAQDKSAADDSMPQSAVNADVVDFVLAPEKIGAHLLRITNIYADGHTLREESDLPKKTSNEKMQCSNEELQNNNEEMQSLNEELETSKEELQSGNEELTILNQDFIDKQDQLNAARYYSDAIVSTIKESLVVLDKNLRIKSANLSFYKKFNITEKETIGKLFFEIQKQLWNDSKLRALLEETWTVKESIEDFPITLTVFKTSLNLLINAREIITEKSTEPLILVSIQDVTDSILNKQLQESETNLLRERQMLYTSFMNAPAGIAILKGPTQIFEFANGVYEKLMGKKVTIGKTVLEHFPEIEEQGYIQLLKNVFSSGESFIANELPVELKTKREGVFKKLFLNLVLQPIKGEKGNTEKILAHVIDVSGQVAARKLIEESEKKNRELIDALPVAVYTCDAEGYIQSFNQAAVELWGRTPEIGKDLWWSSWKFFYNDGTLFPLEECALAIALKTGDILHSEFLIERPDGIRRNMKPYPQPIYDTNGKITGAVNTLIDITEQLSIRKLIQTSKDKLRQALMYLQLATESANVGTWSLNIQSQKLEWSSHHKRMWGYDERRLDLVYEDWYKIILRDDKERALGEVEEAKVNKTFYEVEYRIKKADDNSIRYVRSIGKFYYNDKGEAEILTGITIDITDQKLAEEKIKASEAKFRTLSETVPHMIWTATPEGKKNFFNQYFLDYTGLTYEQLRGDGMLKIIYPADLKRDLQVWQHSLRTGEDFNMEKRIRRHDGIYKWHLSHGIAQKDDKGKIIRWIGTSTEIEEQKKFSEELELKVKERTEALAENEDYLHQIITNAPDAVIVIDDRSIITLWNPKTEEIFGWKAAEVLGLHLSDTIIPTQHRKAHKEGMERFLKTGKARILNKTLELTALNKAGNEFPISLTISRATQQGNKLFIAFLRDITLEKKNKEELILKTNQLVEKNITLEQTNSQLNQFTHTASHDLQEPLRKIMTISSILQQKNSHGLTNETRDYLDKINSASSRMRTLIQNLLSYAQTTNSEELFEQTDLNLILNNVINDFELVFQEKKAQIKNDLLPIINAIPLQMNQLFYNLIGNALKFSKKNIPPIIKISSRILSAQETIKFPTLNPHLNYCEIILEDNGIGFSKQYSQKIFNIFQRLHSNHEYAGTGIGLSICKKIIEKHKGEIFAAAIENEGATFQIILPIKQPK